MDFALFLLFRNFVRLRFKFVVKVNALSYLTARWHCGTQLPYKQACLCQYLYHLLCWPYIFIGCWFLYHVEIYSIIIFITRWKPSACWVLLKQHANVDSKKQISVPQSHLSLSTNLSKSYFYHKDKNTVPENFSKACFLWQTATVLNSNIPVQKRSKRELTVCTFSIWTSCSLVLKNISWQRRF